MSAGTLKLTNNSTAVVGSNTLFSTDLKPGDFIVTTIGGVLYTLPVDVVTSDTSVTLASTFTGPTTDGAAWNAVPQKTMARVTAELVAQSTEALRGLLAEKGVWTNFYTVPDDITIQLSGMAPVTGPGWQKMAGLVSSAVQNTDTIPIENGGTGATTQAAALAALLGNSAVPIENGGTGATTAPDARKKLGLEYGAMAGTVTQGNDARLETVDGKSGGSIRGTVEAVIASAEPAFKSPLAATFQQGPNQFRNVLSHIVLASPDKVMINDAYGDSTTIQARTIVQSASGVFKIYTYDHQGNATAPGSWVNNSDERLKTNVARVSEPLKKMRMLRGVTWDRVDGVPSGQGFIAQELKAVFPTAVFNSGEKLLPDGELLTDVLSVDLAGAAAALHHEAILELMDENETLQSRLEELTKIVEDFIAK